MSGDENRSAYKVDGATLGRITPLLLVLLLLVKAYGVAGFSLTTGTALVTAAPLSVLIGTLALYEYAFMALLAAVSLLLSIEWLFHPERGLRRWAPFTLVLTAFAALLTPLFYLWRAGIATAVVLAVWLSLRRKVSLAWLAAYCAAIALAGFIIATIGRPWLPAEVVTLRQPLTVNPAQAIPKEMSSRPVAYVVSQGNGWVTLLIDEDRYLAVVPLSDIVAQRICHLNGQLSSGQTLYQWLRGEQYTSPNLGCWELTDQPLEKAKRPASQALGRADQSRV